jgi:hypothetical protein
MPRRDKGQGVDAGRVGRRVWVYGAQSYRAFGTAAELTVVPDALAVDLPDDVRVVVAIGVLDPTAKLPEPFAGREAAPRMREPLKGAATDRSQPGSARRLTGRPSGSCVAQSPKQADQGGSADEEGLRRGRRTSRRGPTEPERGKTGCPLRLGERALQNVVSGCLDGRDHVVGPAGHDCLGHRRDGGQPAEQAHGPGVSASGAEPAAPAF